MIAQTFTPGTPQAQLTTFNIQRRVLVVGRENLLEEGVTQLLTIRQDLEVFHTDDLNPSNLAQQVNRIHPDVVILCHLEPELRKSLVAMLANIPGLADLKVIIVHMQNTDLNVHQYHRWFSANLADFFPLVYGKNAGRITKLI